MDGTLPVSLFVIFVVLSLANYVAGYYMASRSYREMQHERSDLREDRRMLVQENKQLREEVFDLKSQLLELRQRINGYEDIVNKLSQELSELKRYEESSSN